MEFKGLRTLYDFGPMRPPTLDVNKQGAHKSFISDPKSVIASGQNRIICGGLKIIQYITFSELKKEIFFFFLFIKNELRIVEQWQQQFTNLYIHINAIQNIL